MFLFSSLINRKSGSRLSVKASSSRQVRRSDFESLEERALLSVTPLSTVSSVLSQYSNEEAGVVAVEVSSEIQTSEVSAIDVSNVLSETVASEEGYDIDYVLLEDGNVRVLGQTGLQQVSSMTYCTITDSVYLELWNKAISRWEEVISAGVEDTVYPYTVDGISDLKIDDVYLYLGFSDSFTSNSSLGSALNAGYYRDGGVGFAATGSLVFNANYFVANPSEDVQATFYNTALHEIAHALGYNVTHFDKLGLLESTTEAPYGLTDLFDSGSSYRYYVGENGVEQYLQSFPEYFLEESDYQDRFLMETYTASGSFGAHLSSALGTYYLYLNERDGMSFSISPKFEATITSMTLGVLEDLGYSVNYDYADNLGTPAPQNLTSEVVGKTVVLNWEKAAGDLSNSTTGAARYQIERLDVLNSVNSDSEDGWITIATDVEGTSFYDSTVEEGHEYSYRVRSCYIRSNEEVGVYRAKAGDEISWESDASKFTIYALVNDGSNKIGWTRVVASTTSKSWTVTSLSQTPKTGTTLFRVVAVGTTLTSTDPSPISNVAVSSKAGDYVPDGYSKDDWNAIKHFLEIADNNGVKNGFKIDGTAYSPDFLQNVTGLTWEQVDGVYRLTNVSWVGYDLVGDLDLSKSSELQTITVEDNSISQVELGSFNVTIVNVDSNRLKSLDVSSLVALESLSCSDNQIGTLDVSNNLNLVFLDCSDNDVDKLNVADNWDLKTLKCDGNSISVLSLNNNETLKSLNPWSTTITSVYLPSGFSETVDMSDAGANSYAWTKSNQTVGDEASYQFDGSDQTVVATLEFDDSTQVVYFYVGNSGDVPSAPSNLTFGELKNGRLETSWTDNAVDEIGYKVYYKINDGDWKFADSVVSSDEVSASTGSIVERTAVGVNTANVYTFKVVSYKLDSNGNEIESEPLTGVYVSSDHKLSTPMNFIAYNYDYEDSTLQLSWDGVDGASYYEVQYRRSDDGGETWRNAWTHAETLSGTSRTATSVHEDSFYVFRVRAISDSGDVSEWTEPLEYSHVPTLPEVTNFVASNFNQNDQTLQLSWTSLETAVFYEVQYRVSNDCGENWQIWTVAEKTSDVSRTAHDVYLPCSYEFRVRARDAEGERSQWTTLLFSEQNAEKNSAALVDQAFNSLLFDEGELFV